MSHQNSTISVNTIEPQSGTTLTIGQSGQNVVVNADSIKNNILKDAGGNALWTSNGSGVLSGLNAGFGSAQVLISTTTVGSPTTQIAITSGIDNTYKEYLFEMINIVPATNNVDFKFETSSNSGAVYGILKTSTNFSAIHNQDDGYAALSFQAGMSLKNSNAMQTITWGNTPNSDASLSGEMHLFNPASTTYAKNWYIRTQQKSTNPRSQDQYVAGYIDTTSVVNAIRFQMSSGNISAGTIKMYGIK